MPLGSRSSRCEEEEGVVGAVEVGKERQGTGRRFIKGRRAAQRAGRICLSGDGNGLLLSFASLGVGKRILPQLNQLSPQEKQQNPVSPAQRAPAIGLADSCLAKCQKCRVRAV